MYIINLNLFIMTVVVPLSAFFSTMFWSRDSSLRAFRSPCDRLSIGQCDQFDTSKLKLFDFFLERFLEQLRAGLVDSNPT